MVKKTISTPVAYPQNDSGLIDCLKNLILYDFKKLGLRFFQNFFFIFQKPNFLKSFLIIIFKKTINPLTF